MSETLEKLELVEPQSCGDNLKAEIDYGDRIAIEVEEPWAGDTETGFGRSGAIRLTTEQAVELADWLLRAVGVLSPSKEPTK